MNAVTIIISCVLLVLLGLALWRIKRKGTCGSGCEGCDGCSACGHQSGDTQPGGHPQP